MVLIMKNLYTILTTVFFLSLLAFSAGAQNSLLRFADKQFALENYAHAVQVYEEAYEKKETYKTAKKVAETYSVLRDYDNAFKWWEKVVSYDEEYGRDDFYNYLIAAMQTGKGMEVERILDESQYEAFDFPEFDFERIKGLYEKRSQVKLSGVPGLNSSGADFGMAKDNAENIYFTSDRGGVKESRRPGIRLDAKNNIFSKEKSSFNNREFFSLYKYTEEGDLSVLSVDLEGALHVSDPSITSDGKKIFYTAVVGETKGRKRDDFSNYPGIYFADLGENGEISNTKHFPINDTKVYGVMHPFVDEISKRVYYSSNKPGGQGGYDIYYVTYDENFNFGDPVNLGAEVNTAGNESHPSISGDKFYFSSDGHAGLGGLDVFHADIAASGISNVMNMGIPYNSHQDDFAYRVTEEGKRYVSSNRSGGNGLDDIYLIEDLHKRLIARIVDCDDNMIEGGYDAELVMKGSSEKITTRKGDNNELLADLDPDQNFMLKITKQGYFPLVDSTLSTIGIKEEMIEKKYTLVAIPYRMPVFVDIVYYDLDKSKIREDAKPVLDKLGELMNKHSFLDLLVASHTDSRASNEYNEKLSERRANAVREYLSEFGITGDRVRLEWHGEEHLTNDCGDGVPCPEPKHQLNRRSEMVLEAFSDPNKQYEMPKELLGKDELCDEASLFEELQMQLSDVPTVYFDFDKSTLRQVHIKELERVAIMLRRMPKLNLFIEGHTDQRGSEAYNLPLSERRAKAVMDYLVNRGLEKSRMESNWKGKINPIHDCNAENCNEAMHQLNRRTELVLRGLKNSSSTK